MDSNLRGDLHYGAGIVIDFHAVVSDAGGKNGFSGYTEARAA